MLLDLYDRLFHKEDIKIQEEKLRLFKSSENSSDRDFVYKKIKDASFSFESKNYTNVITLMEKGLLEGRDNETTTFLTPLLDDAYLLRGTIELWKKELYPHDWIEVNIDGFAFCFDPCFNGICIRSDYNKIFRPKIKAKIPSKDIRKKLITYLSYQGSNGVLIAENNDINSPLYRTYANIKGEVEKDKIKSLNVKFYER